MKGCRRSIYLRGAAVVAAITVLWLAALNSFVLVVGLAGRGDDFSIVRWELTRLTDVALNRLVNVAVRRVASDEQVNRYFELLRQARALRTALNGDANAPASTDARRRYSETLQQADDLRLLVEGRYEAALEDAIRHARLEEHLPLYSGVSFVWPPAATGFSVPPHILIISPRGRIELKDTTLLRSDLTNAAADRIERGAENQRVSALVDQIGGLGAYPSIVDQNDSPLGLMQTVAHEWMHEYLAFHPLGARYAASNDMTLINETVAELVGRELGSMAFDSLGLSLSASGSPATGERGAAGRRLDFDRTMHDLRLEVDRLLKQGNIDMAERRMNETQQQLAAAGYTIRRINQAYFAFYGSYGSNAASSSPLGGKIDTLRRESPSLQTFVRKVQGISQPSDLDRLLQAAAR